MNTSTDTRVCRYIHLWRMYAIVHEHVYCVTGKYEIKGGIRLCRSDGEIKKYFEFFGAPAPKKFGAVPILSARAGYAKQEFF